MEPLARRVRNVHGKKKAHQASITAEQLDIGESCGMGPDQSAPELMMRMLLIGYLHSIRSEQRLCEEVHLNLAYRWFCRLGPDGRVPDHSTFSKNRHRRFRDGDVHRLLFEAVVRARAEAGLVAGRDTAIDASTFEADAGRERKFDGAASANAWDEQERQARPVREYLAALDAALPVAPDEREPVPPKYTSPTDPQAAWSVKHGPERFSYAANYLIDTETSVILDVEATPARFTWQRRGVHDGSRRPEPILLTRRKAAA